MEFRDSSNQRSSWSFFHMSEWSKYVTLFFRRCTVCFCFCDSRGSTTSSKVLKSQKHPRVPLKVAKVIWSVVSTHLKNISQIWSFPQVGVKIRNLWNHHLEKSSPAFLKKIESFPEITPVWSRKKFTSRKPCLKIFEKKRHHPPPRNHQSLVPSHPPPKTFVASIVAAHVTTGGTTPAPFLWKWRWRWLVALQKIESPRLVRRPGARLKRPPCATGRNDGTMGFDEWPGNHLRNQFGYTNTAWVNDHFDTKNR